MNITTLNTTTLDGNVIIKKGGSTTPTPPSGGEILEGEYYLARPNGWYWKWIGPNPWNVNDSSIDALTFTMTVGALESTSDGLYSIIWEENDGRRTKYPTPPHAMTVFSRIFSQDISEYPIVKMPLAFCEKETTFGCKAGNITEIGETHYKSFMDFYLQMMKEDGVPQEDLDKITEEMFAEELGKTLGLQRITKEEYEALITE